MYVCVCVCVYLYDIRNKTHLCNLLPPYPPGGGGGREAAQSGSGECQNSGAVNSFWDKKGGAVNFKLRA